MFKTFRSRAFLGLFAVVFPFLSQAQNLETAERRTFERVTFFEKNNAWTPLPGALGDSVRADAAALAAAPDSKKWGRAAAWAAYWEGFVLSDGLLSASNESLERAETMAKIWLLPAERDGFLADVWNIRASNLNALGLLDEAEVVSQQAVAMNKKRRRSLELAHEYGNLSDIYHKRNDAAGSRLFAQKAVAALFEKGHLTASDSVDWVGMLDFNLAKAQKIDADSLRNIGANEAALKMYRSAEAAFLAVEKKLEKLAPREPLAVGAILPRVRVNRAVVLVEQVFMGYPERADEVLAILENAPLDDATFFQVKTEAFIAQKNWPEAEANLSQAFEKCFFPIEKIDAPQQIDWPFSIQQQALLSAFNTAGRLFFYKAIDAKTDRERQQWAETSLRYYEIGADFFDFMRLRALSERTMIQLDETWSGAHALAMQAAGLAKNWQKAFEFAERGRDFSLRRSLVAAQAERVRADEKRLDLGGIFASKLADRERMTREEANFFERHDRLQNAVNAAEKAFWAIAAGENAEKTTLALQKLREANDAFNAFLKKTSAENARLFARRIAMPAVDLRKIQRDWLDDGRTAFFEFSTTASGFVAFVASSGESMVHQKKFKDPQEWQKMLAESRAELSSPQADQVHGWRLFEVLFSEPLQKLPPTVERLIVVPDGGLAGISFESLLTEKGSKTSFLIQKYEVAVLTSVGVALLNEPSASAGKGKTTAFVANYQNASRNLPKLAKACSNCAKSFGAAPIDPARKAHFLETAAAADQLIFMMHGSTELGLEFSDGWLSFEDIASQKLAARRALVAACSSVFGAWRVGEGLASVSRALAFAGVPNLVASLSELGDDPNVSGLIERFCENLNTSETTGKALRKAKLDFLEGKKGQAAHPFFWANLVHIGLDR